MTLAFLYCSAFIGLLGPEGPFWAPHCPKRISPKRASRLLRYRGWPKSIAARYNRDVPAEGAKKERLVQPDWMQFEAIYENGVLRPLTAVDLPERQLLSVIVSQPVQGLAEVLDWDAHDQAAREGDEQVSLEDVQRGLSKIPGSMAEAVLSQRDER
jgi:predicted DNA-binding antitoxin AbrB/MazE fold protein